MQKASRFVRTATRPLVLGHRGARHAAPENTLRAFELARQEGADGVELDVRVDRDGNVIVLHDTDLSRVSPGGPRGHVEELAVDEVRRADVGDGERIPHLRDVLAWAEANDQCVNVEVKSDVRKRKEIVLGVARELEALKQSERILLSSFDPRIVAVLARRLPRFGVCWLFHENQSILRRLPGWRSLGAIGVNPQHTLLSSYAVRRFKTQGALVNTWTVNEPVLARAYALFGVDSIISDCPGKIVAAL